jgi:DNA-directed RNA polymerase specialized sigma24 family protein
MRHSGTSRPSGETDAQKVEDTTPGQARRRITAAALDGLLSRLDSDRDHAGERYEELRRRLNGLFRWWGSVSSFELADRTLDRVAMKLQEGAAVTAEALPGYVRGVARLVFHESLRERQQEERALRELPTDDDGESDQEEALAALDVCLDTLNPDDRRLILGYYAPGATSMIKTRQSIASALRLSPTALRIRAHRLRQRLEECLAARARSGS